MSWLASAAAGGLSDWVEDVSGSVFGDHRVDQAEREHAATVERWKSCARAIHAGAASASALAADELVDQADACGLEALLLVWEEVGGSFLCAIVMKRWCMKKCAAALQYSSDIMFLSEALLCSLVRAACVAADAMQRDLLMECCLLCGPKALSESSTRILCEYGRRTMPDYGAWICACCDAVCAFVDQERDGGTVQPTLMLALRERADGTVRMLEEVAAGCAGCAAALFAACAVTRGDMYSNEERVVRAAMAHPARAYMLLCVEHVCRRRPTFADVVFAANMSVSSFMIPDGSYEAEGETDGETDGEADSGADGGRVVDACVAQSQELRRAIREMNEIMAWRSRRTHTGQTKEQVARMAMRERALACSKCLIARDPSMFLSFVVASMDDAACASAACRALCELLRTEYVKPLVGDLAPHVEGWKRRLADEEDRRAIEHAWAVATGVTAPPQDAFADAWANWERMTATYHAQVGMRRDECVPEADRIFEKFYHAVLERSDAQERVLSACAALVAHPALLCEPWTDCLAFLSGHAAWAAPARDILCRLVCCSAEQADEWSPVLSPAVAAQATDILSRMCKQSAEHCRALVAAAARVPVARMSEPCVHMLAVALASQPAGHAALLRAMLTQQSRHLPLFAHALYLCTGSADESSRALVRAALPNLAAPRWYYEPHWQVMLATYGPDQRLVEEYVRSTRSCTDHASCIGSLSETIKLYAACILAGASPAFVAKHISSMTDTYETFARGLETCKCTAEHVEDIDLACGEVILTCALACPDLPDRVKFSTTLAMCHSMEFIHSLGSSPRARWPQPLELLSSIRSRPWFVSFWRDQVARETAWFQCVRSDTALHESIQKIQSICETIH
jgi:hypothetical protein